MKVKTEKCQFCKPKTKYLGFIVSEGENPAANASEVESETNDFQVVKRIERPDIQKWQREDETVNKLIKETERRGDKLNNFVIEDGILYNLKKMKEYEQ